MRAQQSKFGLIPKTWQIPDIFRQRLGYEPGRQRLMSEKGQYLVILHKAPTAADRGTREAAIFWVDEHENWKSSPNSGGLSALQNHIEEYAQMIKSLEKSLDSCQQNADSADLLHRIHDSASPLFRASRHMQAVLQELRTLLPNNRKILTLRDTCVTIERSAELLIADTKSNLDFLIAKSAMIQAHEAYQATQEANRLNRLAAFFFPVLTIASILAIENPLAALQKPTSYIILAAGLLLGALLLRVLKFEKKATTPQEATTHSQSGD